MFFFSLQGVCQRERACGEQEWVPKAQKTAADWKGTQWLSGVDLQSWYVKNTACMDHSHTQRHTTIKDTAVKSLMNFVIVALQII